MHTDFVVGRSGGRNNPVKTLSSAVPAALDIMMRSLDRQHPPQLILDTSTAPDLGYRNYPTSLLPDVERFIHDGYDRSTSSTALRSGNGGPEGDGRSHSVCLSWLGWKAAS